MTFEPNNKNPKRILEKFYTISPVIFLQDSQKILKNYFYFMVYNLKECDINEFSKRKKEKIFAGDLQ